MDNKDKLSNQEFIDLIELLYIDRLFPNYIHLPGLGIRMSKESFHHYSEDLYRSYNENGVPGIAAMLGKLQQRPDVNYGFSVAKKMIYSHLDTIGIKTETEKQKYIANITDDITKGVVPKIGEGS